VAFLFKPFYPIIVSYSSSSWIRRKGRVDLDATRLARDASKIAEEIVQHLQSILGSSVGVELEINAELPNGMPENVQRTILENCRTLKFKRFSVEEK